MAAVRHLPWWITCMPTVIFISLLSPFCRLHRARGTGRWDASRWLLAAWSSLGLRCVLHGGFPFVGSGAGVIRLSVLVAWRVPFCRFRCSSSSTFVAFCMAGPHLWAEPYVLLVCLVSCVVRQAVGCSFLCCLVQVLRGCPARSLHEGTAAST